MSPVKLKQTCQN